MKNSDSTIEESIWRFARTTPDKIAVIDENGNRISYAALWENILHAGAALRQLGAKKGDRVILAASKSVDFIYFYFGAHIEGIIAVAVDPETNASRLKYIIEQTSPSLQLGGMRHSESGNVVSFDKAMQTDVESLTLNFPGPADAADILFTTGTTGNPKGVILSNRNIAQAAENINSFIGNDADDTELLALPVSHSFGLGRIRCVLSAGGTIVVIGGFASMKKFYRAIEEYGVTGFGMVPSSWNYITKMSGDRIGRYAGQLKYIEIGSAAMPQAEKRHLMELLPGTRICMHYGLTEASRSAFISFHDDESHLDSAGKASPNCEIAIYSETGQRQPAGRDGEVCVKGSHVCSGYLGNAAEYRNDFYDGYFRTGDWGCLDKDGYLYLKSRTKEIINVGGKKVSPVEVENALMSIPGIYEAACIGIPDEVMGEVVMAYVTTPIDDSREKEIIKIMGTLVENYKVPVKINYTETLPRTASGKLQRLKLKEL